jgi:hypothetical protein
LVNADVEAFIRINLAEVPAAEAEDVHRLDERVMRLLGGVNN